MSSIEARYPLTLLFQDLPVHRMLLISFIVELQVVVW
jgi:hypothetical protein